MGGMELGAADILPISFETAKGTIKRGVRDPQPSDPVRREVYSEGLFWNERKPVSQLRSGHCCILRTHVEWFSGGVATCLHCGEADEDLVHFIRECPATEACRV